MLYIVFTLTLGIVAVNSGNNLLYLAVSGLLSLLAISGILAYANLSGLTVTARAPQEIYAGQPVTVDLEIGNRKRYLPTFLIVGKGMNTRNTLTEISPGSHASLPVRLQFPDRGRQKLGELIITSVFPFALVERGGSFHLKTTCLVYCRPLPVDWKFFERAEMQGEDLPLPLAGIGGDYRGIRDYIPGDSISRVHWKSWVRNRCLMTKEFDAEGTTPVSFSYDTVPGPGMEERLGQLTWLVRTALRRQKAVGLRLPGKTFQPAAGRPHRKKILTALALFEGKGEDS